MKKIILTMLVSLGCIATSFAYTLAPEELVIAQKVSDLIDKNYIRSGKYSSDVMLDILVHILDTSQLSDRTRAILEVSIDSLALTYNYTPPPVCDDDQYYDPGLRDCIDLQIVADDDQDVFGEPEEYVSVADEFDVITSYSISGDDITRVGPGVDSRVSDLAEEIWDIVTLVIPGDYRTDVTKLEIIDDEDEDVYAYVRLSQEVAWDWSLGVNIGLLYENGIRQTNQVIYSLIHELGHVVTLDEDQIDLVNTQMTLGQYERLMETCKTLFLPEGCLKQDSYMYAFIEEFWTQDMLDEVWYGEDPDLYSQDPSGYVTSYAASDPAEDIAESFVYFIFGVKTSHLKVKFFEAYPAIVQMSRDIQENVWVQK